MGNCTSSGGGGGGGGAKLPAKIQTAVQKIQNMVNKSSAFGELVGTIKVSKDKDGNYNLSYTQIKNYGRQKSATIGVGDIPERQETTYTTYVVDSNGRRANTMRRTETNYNKQPAKTSSDDWTGGNANRGVSRTAKRKMKNAMQWASRQRK